MIFIIHHQVLYLHQFIFISIIISTDEDPSLRIESFAIINLRGVSTKYFLHCNRLRKKNIYVLHARSGQTIILSSVQAVRCSGKRGKHVFT